MGDQLELELGVEVAQKPANMEWSYSRRELLEQCPRSYYYHYYGANAKTAKEEPHKEKLKALKALKNRYVRTGEIVHLVIRTYLKKRQIGEVWDVDRLLKWAGDIYKKDRAYSLGLFHPDNEDKPVKLLEFLYEHENAEKEYNESEQKLLDAIKNFMTSETIVPFHSAAAKDDTIIEEWMKLKIYDQPVRGKIDLMYSDEHRVVICDWKIGKPDDFGDSLQLLSYALWAIDRYHRHPDDIWAYKVYLSEGSLSRVKVSDQNLRRAKARILQDIERMQFFDKYGRDAIAEAFTPCNKPKICLLCSFQGICPRKGEM
jgi:CRISPR/Cas system-associated exonuclease Cas4 (RecB family)